VARIPLIVADSNKDYLDSLCDYLLSECSQTFEVISFSNSVYLEQYLAEQIRSGILLYEPAMLGFSLSENNLIHIRLSVTPILYKTKERQVFKYLSGPLLVQNILQQLSEAEIGNLPVLAAVKKAKVVAVYSPAGGVGKTTVAVGCSLQIAWEGQKVFYLNLEDLSSTGVFFKADSGGALADALYYLKEKKNPGLKIKALKAIDQQSKIHYFAPNGSDLDLGEEAAEPLRGLINLLKNSGDYDYVVIDLSSQLNTNNLAALEASDTILLVMTPEPNCQEKVKLFITELSRWSARQKSSLPERIYPLWNKWPAGLAGEEYQNSTVKEPLARIPWVDGLLLKQGEHCRLDLNGSFGTALYQVRTRLKELDGGKNG